MAKYCLFERKDTSCNHTECYAGKYTEDQIAELIVHVRQFVYENQGLTLPKLITKLGFTDYRLAHEIINFCLEEKYFHLSSEKQLYTRDYQSDAEDKKEKQEVFDAVNKPAHYNAGKIEVIEAIEDWGLDKDFCLGNAIKYIARAGKKDPAKTIEDLNKAIWYINRKIKGLTPVK